MAGNPHILQGAKLRPVAANRAAVLLPPSFTRSRVMAGFLGLVVVAVVFFYVFRVSERMRTQNQIEYVVPADGEGLGSEVQFSDLEMSQATANDPLELRDRVSNAGNHLISGALVQLTFKDSAGRKLPTIQTQILSMTEKPDPNVSNNFSGDPIEPDESRAFRVLVRNVPARWDHNLPEVKVITVCTDLD
jgi:hypothetical protein